MVSNLISAGGYDRKYRENSILDGKFKRNISAQHYDLYWIKITVGGCRKLSK